MRNKNGFSVIIKILTNIIERPQVAQYYHKRTAISKISNSPNKDATITERNIGPGSTFVFRF